MIGDHGEHACDEAQAALTIPPGDPVADARVSLHLGRCERCRLVAQQLRRVRDDVLAVDADLDDVRRARMLTKMAAALDEMATDAGRAPIRRSWRAPILVFATAAAACVALVGAMIWQRSQADRVATATHGDWGEVTREAGVLRATDRPVDEPPSARLTAGPGEWRRALLAGRARLTLVGPGQLVIEAVTTDRIELRVVGGLLIGDYDRRQGGSLVVRSPGARTEIVGTVFSVDARGGQTRVAVARGRVRTRNETDGAERSISAGEAWRTGSPATEAIPDETRALFQRHEEQHLTAAEPGPQPTSQTAAAAEPPATTSVLPAPAAPTPSAAATPPLSRARRLALRSATTRASDPTPPSPTREPSAAPESPAHALTPPQQVVQAPPPAASRAEPAPAATAKPPTEAPVLPPATAESLYEAAERALGRGDPKTARATLERLQREHANDPLADTAGYDLALMSLRSRDHARAARLLDKVIAGGREPALREGARHLRCRVERDARRPREALACLERLRMDLPGGSRDAEALSTMVAIAVELGDCARARSIAAEHARRHPRAGTTAEIEKRMKTCAR